ncbi:MAG: hypothetical protein CMM74_06835 [Rhodospirillaceae bacterium]|nr:hypothetical protein [Rhodospirillaceae bacterium]
MFIASQTNLLALNATIKAAEGIGIQISVIQSATKTSTEAINGITSTIGNIKEIVSRIAAAVVEQGAATQEITGNVHQAATST